MTEWVWAQAAVQMARFAALQSKDPRVTRIIDAAERCVCNRTDEAAEAARDAHQRAWDIVLKARGQGDLRTACIAEAAAGAAQAAFKALWKGPLDAWEALCKTVSAVGRATGENPVPQVTGLIREILTGLYGDLAARGVCGQQLLDALDHKDLEAIFDVVRELGLGVPATERPIIHGRLGSSRPA